MADDDCLSDNVSIASRKSDLHNQYPSDEISATHSVDIETELSQEDIDLSHNGKAGTACCQQDICCSVDRSKNEKTSLSASASTKSSELDVEKSGNGTNTFKSSLQNNAFPGYEYDEKLNFFVKPEDVPKISINEDGIISEDNSSVDNKEMVFGKDSEKTNTETNNCMANTEGENNCMTNRENGNELKEIILESDDENQTENVNALALQRESQYSDKLKLLLFDECGTDQKSLDNFKDKSYENSPVKTSDDCKEQPTESKHTNENIEDIMTYLQSFVTFQVRDVIVYMMRTVQRHPPAAEPVVKWHPPAVDDIPWNWLNEEKWRLHTYSRYPHGANKSAILLAGAGFAYIGSGKGSDDKVICYFCCTVKQDWQPSDVIPEVHSHLAPDCSMVTGINCDNVPMAVPKVGLNLFSQLHNFRELLASENTRQKARDEIDRDGAEPSQVSGQQANNGSRQTSTQSVGNNQNGTSAPVRHLLMATQTIMGPSSSPTGQSAPDTARFSQPISSDVPSTTVTSNSILANPASSETGTSGIQITGPQGGSNSEPSETPTADTSNQNVHQLSDQTAASSSATVVSQVSQGNSSHSQNLTATTLSSITTTTTTLSSTTPAAPSALNTSVSQSATLSQETPSQNTGDSQNSARAAGRNPTYGELGIITERPKRYEFAVRAKRYESFEPWPRDHHLKKEDLADAGFYYAGYGDCARCFYCGGGLRNWEDNDNVWVEHARWFPKCAFIRQTMGQQFVDAVQDLNKNHDQITFEMVTNKMGSSAASFQLDTKNMPLKRDPAVITVLGMGYEDKDVLEAANSLKESCGVLSADKLFEKLEQDGKRRRTTESPPESQAIRNNRESKDEEVMNQLKEQNNQLRQQTVCKICMDKEVAVVFLPCGHLVSCTDCAAALKDCPVCRNLVRGIVRAFMA